MTFSSTPYQRGFQNYRENIMTDRFEPLENGEVISVQHEAQILIGHRTFRVCELNDAIKQQLETSLSGWTAEKSDWFTSKGIECEALRFGSNGWQKGKIRLCLEFAPDDPTAAAASASQNVTISPPPPQIANVTKNTTNEVNLPKTIAATPTAQSVEAVEANSVPLPFQGIAVGTVAAAATAAVMAVTQPEVVQPKIADFIPPEVPDVQPGVSDVQSEVASIPTVEVSREAETVQEIPAVNTAPTPHVTDAVLVLEEDRAAGDRHPQGMPDIIVEFDNNGNRQGTVVPDGTMELDLTDLDFDRAEQDYLNFEPTGMSDLDREFANFQDKSENSGVLIDEVWNEISQQPNWPGIH